MAIYVCLMGLIFLFGIPLLDKRYQKSMKGVCLFFSLLFMTLVLGMRSETVGEDTVHYLEIFKYAQSIPFKDILTHIRLGYYTNQFGYTDTIECGFLLICRIIGIFTQNNQAYLLILAVIIYGLIGKFIRDNVDNYFLAIYIVLCDFFFMYSFNGIRQLIAVSIAAQAYHPLKNKNYKKAFILIAIASYIHNSSVLCYVLFPIMIIKGKKSYKTFKIATIIAICIPMIISSVRLLIGRVLPRYLSYFYNNYWTNSLGGSVILYIFELILIMYLYRKKFYDDDELYVLSIFTIMYLSFEIAGLQVSILGRMSYYFRIYIILFIPKVLAYFHGNSKVFVKSIVMLLLFLLFLSYASSPSRSYSFLI